MLQRRRFLEACVWSWTIMSWAMPATGWAQESVPQYPLAVAVGTDGTVFLADRNLPGVWKLVDGKPVVHFQGSKKFRTPLNAVRCLAIDRDGKLLAGDSSTREVYRFDDQGQPQPLTKGGVGIPMALAVDANGDIWAADIEIHRLVKIPAAGGEAEIMVEVPAPRGLAFDGEGRLWVVSHGKDQILKLAADGRSYETVVAGQPFSFPHQLAFDAAGVPFVTDGYSKAVWKIPAGGMPEKVLEGPPLDNPVGIWRKGETLLVVDPRANALFELGADGKVLRTVTLGKANP
jgi:sugar lactone lactonase YvrE